MGRRLRRLEPAPAAGAGRRLSSPAGRPRGEPALRHGAARERGRRRSAYEAPHGSVAPGPVSSGAESKRRRCPRSRARQSRVTLLAPAALEVALGEEVRIELLVELHVGDLDHGVRPRGGGRDLEGVRDGDRADRLDVALRDPLLRLGRVLVELEPARHQVVAPEPDHDLLVADVLALRGLLDRPGGRAVDRLLSAQARARVGLGPGRHLLDQVEIVVAEIGAHEALVAGARGDLAHALQLGQVEPLVGGPALVGEGEEGRSLHLRGGEEEEDGLLLVARLAAVEELDLAHALAAAPDDGELHLLVAVVPVARGVVEGLAAGEGLARRLGGAGGPRPRGPAGGPGKTEGAHPGRGPWTAPPA